MSDRGNVLWGRTWPVSVNISGHLLGTFNPVFAEARWFVTNTDTSKEVVAGGRSSADTDHQEAVLQRLADLGYK